MQLLQLVVFDDHRFDAHAGLELDLIDGVQIGGIRDAEEQALAAAIQRQAAMLLEKFVLDELDGVQVDVVRVEVVQRNAEFGGRGDGDVARLGGAGGDELGDEAGLAVFGRLQGREHGGFFDHAILHEALRQAAEPRSIAAECERCVVVHVVTCERPNPLRPSLLMDRRQAIVKSGSNGRIGGRWLA